MDFNQAKTDSIFEKKKIQTFANKKKAFLRLRQSTT